MILDIKFRDSAPIQYQHVRMTTVYTEHDGSSAEPELVIHFHDGIYPQVNIPLRRIVTVMTTND